MIFSIYFRFALARAADDESLEVLLEDDDELERELDPLLELRELEPLDFELLLEELNQVEKV